MMSTKFSPLTTPCSRPYPPHDPHPISELRRGGVYPLQGKPPPSRGRNIWASLRIPRPLVPVLRGPARSGTEDEGGEKGGGSNRTLASKYGDATQGLGDLKNFLFFS
jgi:hypothetical protein